jgi:Fe2+ transport system protein FeoA
MPVDESIPLSALQPDQQAVVRRVHARDQALLRHLEELGLMPGTRMKVLEVSPFDQVMQIQIYGQNETLVLGLAITSRVFVENL